MSDSFILFDINVLKVMSYVVKTKHLIDFIYVWHFNFKIALINY